jgi:hypothetical protein
VCRIPKVIVVAPDDVGAEARRKLSSLDYEIVAVVTSAADARGVKADVAVIWDPDEDDVARLRELSLKTVAVGGRASSADMSLTPEEAASFKERIWELFRPR